MKSENDALLREADRALAADYSPPGSGWPDLVLRLADALRAERPKDWFTEKMLDPKFRDAYVEETIRERVRERLGPLRRQWDDFMADALLSGSKTNEQEWGSALLALDQVARALLNLPPDADPWEENDDE